MGAAGVEIPEWVNETTVERAYRRALKAQGLHAQGFAASPRQPSTQGPGRSFRGFTPDAGAPGRALHSRFIYGLRASRRPHRV